MPSDTCKYINFLVIVLIKIATALNTRAVVSQLSCTIYIYHIISFGVHTSLSNWLCVNNNLVQNKLVIKILLIIRITFLCKITVL